jgi:hypothetical protein
MTDWWEVSEPISDVVELKVSHNGHLRHTFLSMPEWESIFGHAVRLSPEVVGNYCQITSDLISNSCDYHGVAWLPLT